jgi:hypothetical protein
MEKLSKSMAWNVLWKKSLSYHCARGSCFAGFVDLALFFWLPGTLNDINVLYRSHLFKKLIAGDAPAERTQMSPRGGG